MYLLEVNLVDIPHHTHSHHSYLSTIDTEEYLHQHQQREHESLLGIFRGIFIGDIIVVTGALLYRPLSDLFFRLIREEIDQSALAAVANGRQSVSWKATEKSSLEFK